MSLSALLHTAQCLHLEYVGVWFSTVRISAQKLFLYVVVLYCVTLLAMTYVWTSVDLVWWRRWKCPDPSPPPLLCIFTTFKPNWKKLAIYNNTLHNWSLLSDSCRLRVQPILFVVRTNESVDVDQNLAEIARGLGWTVLDVPRVSSIGIPCIRDMYADVADRYPSCSYQGYTNGDILFDRGLARTMHAVAKVSDVLGSTLVIGRRTNVRGYEKLQQYLPDDMPALARQRGKLFWFSAEDYFIMSAGGYPWYRVPRDVVVGRIGYDNFLVYNALRHNVSVVDATNTVLAVHQTGSDGNLAGHGGKHAGYNMGKIGWFNFRAGLTRCSQFLTGFVNDSHNNLEVEVARRPRPPPRNTSRSTRRRNRRQRQTTTTILQHRSSTRRRKPTRKRKQIVNHNSIRKRRF